MRKKKPVEAAPPDLRTLENRLEEALDRLTRRTSCHHEDEAMDDAVCAVKGVLRDFMLLDMQKPDEKPRGCHYCGSTETTTAHKGYCIERIS